MNRQIIALIVISLGLLAIRLFFIMNTMVIDDEAYYAMYSRHLAWGYIDHGPVIAIVIKLGIFLFGENGFGVRFGALALYTLLSIFLYLFGKKEFNKNTGVILFTTYWINILFHTNGIVSTPDVPLAFFSIFAIIFYYKAYFEDANFFYLGGFILGLALLSKISALFIAAGFGLFPVICSQLRVHLKDFRFYFSFLIAFAVFSPFIIWNVQNDWAFVRYQGAHIAQKGSISTFFELWAGSAILLGPVLFYYTVSLPWKQLNLVIKNKVSSAKELYFAVVTAVPFFYFVSHSFFSRFELNWPAPVFYGGLFLFSIHTGKAVERFPKCLIFQWGLSLFLVLLISVQTMLPFLPVKGKNDITNRYFIYDGLIKNLELFLLDNTELKNYRISANNYQIPSMINLYLKPEKEAACLSVNYHQTLYSFLYPLESLKKDRLLFIGKGDSFPEFLSPHWSQIEFLTSMETERNGNLIQKYSLWKLSKPFTEPN